MNVGRRRRHRRGAHPHKFGARAPLGPISIPMLIPIAPAEPGAPPAWAIIELQGEVERKDGGSAAEAFDIGLLEAKEDVRARRRRRQLPPRHAAAAAAAHPPPPTRRRPPAAAHPPPLTSRSRRRRLCRAWSSSLSGTTSSRAGGRHLRSLSRC